MKNLKGIILGMAFVFGMSFTADANVTNEHKQGCLQDAWDFGTGWADEWQATNWYVETFC